jgi:hypothetical protein
VSLGSCDELRSLLEAAVAFGVLGAAEQQRLDALADRDGTSPLNDYRARCS